MALDAEARGVTSSSAFDHIYFCAARTSCIYVPVELVPVIELSAPAGVELSCIGSAPQLARECQTLLTVYDQIAETSRDYDWLLIQGEHPDVPGLRRVTGPTDLEEELDLVWRLMRVAREAMVTGTSITFS